VHTTAARDGTPCGCSDERHSDLNVMQRPTRPCQLRGGDRKRQFCFSPIRDHAVRSDDRRHQRQDPPAIPKIHALTKPVPFTSDVSVGSSGIFSSGSTDFIRNTMIDASGSPATTS
jgi:hypothetical protein